MNRKRGDHGVVVAPDRERFASVPQAPGREFGRGQLRVEVTEPRWHVAITAPVAEHLDTVTLRQSLVERHAVTREVGREERNGHGDG